MRYAASRPQLVIPVSYRAPAWGVVFASAARFLPTSIHAGIRASSAPAAISSSRHPHVAASVELGLAVALSHPGGLGEEVRPVPGDLPQLGDSALHCPRARVPAGCCGQLGQHEPVRLGPRHGLRLARRPPRPGALVLELVAVTVSAGLAGLAHGGETWSGCASWTSSSAACDRAACGRAAAAHGRSASQVRTARSQPRWQTARPR